MVTGLCNKYHPIVLYLLQITHKQAYYVSLKKPNLVHSFSDVNES